ncbi:putative exported protein, partial [Yersinia pestis PY-101]|jgi:hypothetical protein
MDVF